MQCDHKLVVEHINEYVENQLSPELRQQVAQTISSCDECQMIYQQCVQLNQLSQQWQEQEVPQWHRTSYAVRPAAKSASWLNWGAMATSSLAILMVVFQLEIYSNESGLTISFGGSQNKQVIQKMVTSQLAEYQDKQDKVFLERLTAAFDKQDNRNQLRLANWMEKNRTERQQEIKFVMSGWQTQRYQDQTKVDQQLSYIAENQIENNQMINQLYRSNEPKK